MSAALRLIDALGGPENICEVEPCVLRIRVEVKTQAAVNEAALRVERVLAIVRSGTVVQILAGCGADEIAAEMRDMCATHSDTDADAGVDTVK